MGFAHRFEEDLHEVPLRRVLRHAVRHGLQLAFQRHQLAASHPRWPSPNRRGQAADLLVAKPHGRRGAVGGLSLIGDSGAPCRTRQGNPTPYPSRTGGRRSWAHSTARRFPEMPLKRPETASEPCRGVNQLLVASIAA